MCTIFASSSHSFQEYHKRKQKIENLHSVPVAFGPLLLGNTPKDIMGHVQSVVDTSMSGVSLISVALVGFLGQFLPVGVILTGCGIMIALAGLFGWFAIQEPTTAQPERRLQF
jgi:hypothetical protein